jgi:hypothetical protein
MLKRLTYGSWSMAQGIKQGMSCFSPKIWGNELENEGAAWTATKWYLPMLSLLSGDSDQVKHPKTR